MDSDQEEDVPEEGAVLTFGRSRFAENQSSRFWIKRDPITACACGDEHTVVVAESHRVFVFGANEFGQLGLGHSRSVARPSCIKALKSESCTAVGCGKSHTVLGTADGKLFAFGQNQDGQLGLGHTDSGLAEVTAWSGRAVQLDAGVSHTAALTERGRLFTWGSNAEGQCGLGDSPGACLPTLVPSDEEVVKLSCGYRHSAFITASGRLYMFGENDEGQLGLGDREKRERPSLLTSLQHVAEVACGGQHTIVLQESGKVWCFGCGAHGQLGLGARVLSSPSPALLEAPLPAGARVRQVAAGHCHSALVTDDGHLYTFGDPRHGKLCSSREEESSVFTPQLASGVNHLVVNKVVLGGCQSMVLVDRVQSPGTRQSLRTVGRGDLGSNDRDSAARQKRREKEMSLTAGRQPSLPPLKGAPRPRSLLDAQEEAIQSDPDTKSSARSGEIRGSASLTDLPAAESSKADVDEEAINTIDEVTVPGKKEGSKISRLLSRFRRKKVHQPDEDVPVEKPRNEEVDDKSGDADLDEELKQREASAEPADNEEAADAADSAPSEEARQVQPGTTDDPAEADGDEATADSAETADTGEQAPKKKRKVLSKTCVVV